MCVALAPDNRQWRLEVPMAQEQVCFKDVEGIGPLLERPMPFLVEILLPIIRSRRNRTNLDSVRKELTERFGGITLHVNAPAEGLWEDDGDVEEDRIIVVEVMVDDLDRAWWSSYRADLEVRFRQEEIVLRAVVIERL